jgi:hypothetical protein
MPKPLRKYMFNTKKMGESKKWVKKIRKLMFITKQKS